jgi:hypothetical protein
MKQGAFVLLLAGVAIAGCSQTVGSISPNDPQYARSGAPRAGEPMPQPGNSYGRIQGPDGQGGMR